MTEAQRNIVRIDEARIKDAASVLSRAFQNDPVFVYLIPDAATRETKSRYIFDMLVRYSVSKGEVYATSTNLEAVAVWLPHDRADMNFWNGIRHGGIPVLLHLSPACVVRQLNGSESMCSMHRSLATYRHKYLYLLGTQPHLQKKGYAGAVMRPMLAELDRESLPCYLDNTDEKNTVMYEHYGFTVIKEYKIPKTQVRIWAMVREPRRETMSDSAR